VIAGSRVTSAIRGSESIMCLGSDITTKPGFRNQRASVGFAQKGKLVPLDGELRASES